MAHINIYTADFTRLEDDVYFYGSFFTNRKAAQAACDKMNKLHDERHPDEDKTWRYIVHKHIAFSW